MAETDPLDAAKAIVKTVTGMHNEAIVKAFKMALVYLDMEELIRQPIDKILRLPNDTVRTPGPLTGAS